MSLLLACLWVVLAWAASLFPSRDHHWRTAYVLIALGIPLVGYVAYENGLWVAGAVTLAGGSVLRWPVIFLVRWIRRKLGIGQG